MEFNERFSAERRFPFSLLCLAGYGAIFNAKTASGAQIHVDAAGALSDRYFEISR